MESKFRKRHLILCFIVVIALFFSGCNKGKDYQKQIDDLNDKVAYLEIMLGAGVSASFYPYSCISGGTTGCMDKTDGDSLSDGDKAFVVLEDDVTFGNAVLIYVLDDSSSCGGDATDGYSYIRPDTNYGTKCWEFAKIIGSSFVGGSEWGTEIDQARSLSGADLRGKLHMFTGAYTATLDNAATALFGSISCYVVRDDSEAAVIDVQGTEKINLNGTAGTTGQAITATGAGESVCMIASTDTDNGTGTDGYYAWGATSGWALQ